MYIHIGKSQGKYFLQYVVGVYGWKRTKPMIISPLNSNLMKEIYDEATFISFKTLAILLTGKIIKHSTYRS